MEEALDSHADLGEAVDEMGGTLAGLGGGTPAQCSDDTCLMVDGCRPRRAQGRHYYATIKLLFFCPCASVPNVPAQKSRDGTVGRRPTTISLQGSLTRIVMTFHFFIVSKPVLDFRIYDFGHFPSSFMFVQSGR